MILRAKRMEGQPVGKKDGGAVPAKFKGFSKLPEAVQVKMDPVAAKKYEKGVLSVAVVVLLSAGHSSVV